MWTLAAWSPSVRAGFGIQRSDKSLGSVKSLSTKTRAVLEAGPICRMHLRARQKTTLSESYFSIVIMWQLITVTGRRCGKLWMHLN